MLHVVIRSSECISVKRNDLKTIFFQRFLVICWHNFVTVLKKYIINLENTETTCWIFKSIYKHIFSVMFFLLECNFPYFRKNFIYDLLFMCLTCLCCAIKQLIHLFSFFKSKLKSLYVKHFFAIYFRRKDYRYVARLLFPNFANNL